MRVKSNELNIVGLDREGRWIYETRETEEEERKDKRLSAVSPSGVKALMKVMDDPVESGKGLAKGSEKLPSDRWKADGGAVDRGMKVVSWEEKETEDIKRAIAASIEDEKVRGVGTEEPQALFNEGDSIEKKEGEGG